MCCPLGRLIGFAAELVLSTLTTAAERRAIIRRRRAEARRAEIAVWQAEREAGQPTD